MRFPTAAFFVALSASLSAQQPDIVATRTSVAPRIDGRTDDAAWSHATPHRAFQLFVPREGGDPNFPSEVRVLYDSHALYFLVRAFDRDPHLIARRLARRDTYDPADDHILLFIDAFRDRRSGYQFAVTPAGVKLDYLLFSDGLSDASWDGVWDVATAIDSLGWVAEFAVPFHQLRVPAKREHTFGIFVGRWVGRTGERSALPQYRRSLPGIVSQMGVLEGVRDIDQGGTLETTPYVLTRIDDEAGVAARGRPLAGVDAKWLPRPGVTVDATFNPDFGQVEADPAVLNLSGVEVVQLERRSFFKEGGGLLALPLGDATDGAAMFYSRRIGRSPTLTAYAGVNSPAVTTIAAAARGVVRFSPTTTALALSAVTGEEYGAWRPDRASRYLIEPRAHYGLVRAQRNYRGGRSGIGAMLTRIDRGGDSLTRSLLPSQVQAGMVLGHHQSRDGALQLEGWIAASDMQGDVDAIARVQRNAVHAFQRPDDGIAFDARRSTLRGSAARISGGKAGRGLTRLIGSYRVISPGFDVNEMGFLTVSGIQSAAIDMGLARTTAGRMAGIGYRNAATTLRLQSDWSMSGLPYARGVSLSTNLQLSNMTLVIGQIGRQIPGAHCTVFCTRGGPAIVDPPAVSASLDVRGDPRRTVVPNAIVQWDRDDGGRSFGLSAQLSATAKVRSNVNVSLAAAASDSRRAAFYYSRLGDELSDTARYFVARLVQPTRAITARADWTLTPTLTVQTYAQAHVSRGTYGDTREIVEPRATDWDRRFRQPTEPVDGPLGIDFKRFRSNSVIRWEYRRGSALFIVWSQGRDRTADAPGGLSLWPGRDLDQLFALPSANTIALKLSYWSTR